MVELYSAHKALCKQLSRAKRCLLLSCLAFSVITGLVLMDLLKCKYRSSDGVFCVQYSVPGGWHQLMADVNETLEPGH